MLYPTPSRSWLQHLLHIILPNRSNRPNRIKSQIASRAAAPTFILITLGGHTQHSKKKSGDNERYAVSSPSSSCCTFSRNTSTRTYAQNAFLYHTFTLPFVGLGGGGVWWWCWSSVTLMMLAFCWTWSVPKRCCCTGVRWVVRNTHSPDERF